MIVPHKGLALINRNKSLPFKLDCPVCQQYTNVEMMAWDFFIPETPDLVHKVNTHCCPSCCRMWRIFGLELK